MHDVITRRNVLATILSQHNSVRYVIVYMCLDLYVCDIVFAVLACFIIPFYTCHVRTGPSDSPQNVSHGSLSDSSVQLFWSPPPLDNQNGIIIGYNVYIVNANNTVISRALELSVRLTTKVESLEEFTTFWFWLSAVTAVGEGPYTVTDLLLRQ